MPVTRSIQQTIAADGRRARARVYADARWKACRASVLRMANGYCQWPGCQAPATIADHWPLTLAVLLATNADPYNPAACRALCAHHSGKADGGRI